VEFVSVSPADVVTIHIGSVYERVYAGVMNLEVDGVPYDGFCIDVWHEASAQSLNYTIDPLASSPLTAPMGAAAADLIKEIWAHGFSNALLTNDNAAAFQVAVWGALLGNFNWYVSGPAGVLSDAQALILWANQNSGALANVVGLNQVPPATGAPSAQSYAIELPVPDGGATLMLLGGALIGLGALCRKVRG
jgi:hypothetical protein